LQSVAVCCKVLQSIAAFVPVLSRKQIKKPFLFWLILCYFCISIFQIRYAFALWRIRRK